MKAWLLARKDLRVYFRDRTAVLLGFGLPIVLCTVFGGAMGAIGGGDGALERVELVVEDADGGAAARALLDALGESAGLRLDVLTAEEIAAGETARTRVAEGDAPAGLRIAPGFGAEAADGGAAALVLYRDPAKLVEQQILAGNLIPALVAARGEEAGKRITRSILATLEFPAAGRERAQALLDASWRDMSALVDELEAKGAFAGDEADAGGEAEADAGEGFDFAALVGDLLGVRVEDVAGGDEHRRSQRRAQQTQAVAGMAVMMLLFGLIHCGGTLLDERDSGTLDRLRLVPGASGAVLGGKFLFTWTVGLLQLVTLFAYGSLVFDVPVFRAPAALVAVSAATAAAVTGFGVLFAVLARSRAQLEGLSTIVVLTMSALGGSWWPLAITPDWYRFLGHFTINAWAMDGYQGVFWYGKDLAGVLPEVGVLLAIAAVTTAGSWALWGRRMRG